MGAISLQQKYWVHEFLHTLGLIPKDWYHMNNPRDILKVDIWFKSTLVLPFPRTDKTPNYNYHHDGYQIVYVHRLVVE
jgi:hypothetical protein